VGNDVQAASAGTCSVALSSRPNNFTWSCLSIQLKEVYIIWHLYAKA
jgi:hypothetical protein